MNRVNFSPFPNLTTEHLNLRQITDRDFEEFFILKSDERLLKTYDAKAKTREEARRFLHKLTDEIRRNEWINWGIARKADGRIIGSVCFWNISEEQSKAELGYELMAEWQGKGIMQEAVQAVIAYGFHNMGLRRIEACPDPNHAKSIRLLERNRFARGADFTETDPSDGRILQRVTYSLNTPDRT